MIRTLIAGIAAVLLDCGAAFSQVGTGAPVPSPLGITSPLGMAPGSPVPPGRNPDGRHGTRVARTQSGAASSRR
jgi:hypothetical protein